MAGRDEMPSSVSDKVGAFDRFAGAATSMVSRAWFFTACVLLVVVWVPSYWLVGNVDTWQLIINTATTIITFLLVALLQNAQQRADQASQRKLNAVAEGLAQLLTHVALRTDSGGQPEESASALRSARDELCAAVGLENRETS